MFADTFKVIAFRNQLAEKDLLHEGWEQHPTQPQSVVQEFFTLDSAINCYHTLRIVHKVAAYKNWLI